MKCKYCNKEISIKGISFPSLEENVLKVHETSCNKKEAKTNE